MHDQSSAFINVFDYTDYRQYLADYYKFQKKKNPAFSYRFFAKRAGFSSSGFYKELVDGKRSLSRALILKFSIALHHSKKQAEYFECLVYFNESKTVEERMLYFKKMMAAYESKALTLFGNQYEYFSKWYYCVVREVLSYLRVKDNYRELARALNPPIRDDQAKKALEILEKLDLIKKDAEGCYVPTSPVITTGSPSDNSEVNRMNLINFQKSMMAMAEKAYDLHPLRKIDMSTLTLSISDETFLTMKEEIGQFRKKLLSMAEKDEHPDRVYQLGHFFFPLAGGRD